MELGASWGGLGERRFVTLLFSDLCHSTRIAMAMDAEAYAELLERVRAVSEPIVDAHGGRVAQVYGDGSLSVFGSGDAADADAANAIDAALALHAAVRGLERPADCPVDLRLHSGVHTGLVLLRDGDLARGRVEATGIATSIAARLAAAAGPDELLVSETSVGPARRVLRLGEAREVAVDRAGESVKATPVLGPAPAAGMGAGASRATPFVGRTGELAAFGEALSKTGARTGAPLRLAVVAPAGQGKSRLAEAFGRMAAEAEYAVFAGACPGGPAAGVLIAWAQIVAGMREREAGGELAEPLRALLDRMRGRGGGGEPLADAFVQVVARRAERGPVLLVIDDWQWADGASMQLLARLTGSGAPVAIVLTTREAAPHGIPLDGWELLFLPPLDLEQSRALIRHCDPRLDPLDAAKVHARAGGNPLYIEELCHLADGRPRSLDQPAGGPERIGWLAGMIGARLEALAGEEAAALHAAAVIGEAFPLWLFEAVVGDPRAAERLEALVARDFLVAGPRAGRFRFKHGVTWEVVYSLVPIRERKALHARAAAALLDRPGRGGIERDEMLAWHHAASDRIEEAALAAERAGDAAAGLRALDRAQLQYRRALTLLERLPPTDGTHARMAGLVARFGMVSVFDPEPSHLAIFDAAAARADARGETEAAAQAEFWAAYSAYATGDGRRSVAYARRALERCGAEETPFVVQLRATLGQAEGLLGRYDEALALLDGAIDVKRRHRSGRHASLGVAYSLTSKAAILGDLGRFDEAMAAIDEAVALMNGENHPVEASILNWAGAIRLWQGRPDAALEAAARARVVATRAETVYLHAMSRAIDGYARWRMTGGPDARRDLADAVTCMAERGKTLGASLAFGWLAEAEAESGAAGAARRAIGGALRRARAGDRLGAAMAARAAARLHRREPARALAWIARARLLAAPRRAPHEAAATDLLEAELRASWGGPDAARPLLDRAEAGFAAMGMLWHLDRAANLAGAASP
ncbi:AAA family ATPase [Sphingomonas lenta]|uniref:AAA family ATPase n=1 Tax=Sphingomonas lenta TaxID=1141887 RepID=UPI001FE85A1A|nr:AAA family ATPase [Sphingomonas lenta]